MISEYREKFNREWRQEHYDRIHHYLKDQLGMDIPFWQSETPIFIPRDLMNKMIRYARNYRRQLFDQPEYVTFADRAIPDTFKVPNETPHPIFIQCDYAITIENGEMEPKLIEFQGFPSLYSYQALAAQAYLHTYPWLAPFKYFLGGLDNEKYTRVLREAIVGDHEVENAILLEYQPEKQKTLPDFIWLEKTIGVKAVCITDIRKTGKNLYYRAGGKEIPIRRIFNRTIVDELLKENVRFDFRFSDEVDVEWAGHPNWYFKLSKLTMPFIDHPSVPKAFFLDQLTEYPDHLENYVLKPLFSFAGSGVILGPLRAQLDMIPEDQRKDYLLQERIEYAPVVHTPFGGTKAEVRTMFLWLDRLIPVSTLIRLSRSKMMNVDFNAEERWIGASIGCIPH